MMTEAQVIMFKCICAYGRICELQAKTIKSVWELDELKMLEDWWNTLTPQQHAKIKNVMRKFSVQAQVLAQKNLKDKKDA